MIVEYRWLWDGCPCRTHPGSRCFFEWVPSMEQVELLDGIEDFSYLDKVVSVSGRDEGEGAVVGSPISPSSDQLSLLMEVV